MKYKDFSELPVYKKARHLRKRIYELVKTLPSFEEYNLKLQMRKAATSVTNNIAEGNGRYYYQENLHFCRISRGSLLAFDQEVQMLFIPKYCCWLNLIEPWWKQLRSLALKGHRFEDIDEVILSILKATEYWNNHCYPYDWGKKANPLAILNTSHT